MKNFNSVLKILNQKSKQLKKKEIIIKKKRSGLSDKILNCKVTKTDYNWFECRFSLSQSKNFKHGVAEKNKRLEKEIVASTNEIRELKKVKNEEEKNLIELNITNQELVVRFVSDENRSSKMQAHLLFVRLRSSLTLLKMKNRLL